MLSQFLDSTVNSLGVRPRVAEVHVAHLCFPRIRSFGKGNLVWKPVSAEIVCPLQIIQMTLAPIPMSCGKYNVVPGISVNCWGYLGFHGHLWL